jgi:hypothetical protein
MKWSDLNSVTKVGIVLFIVTFLLTMNPLVTAIILLTHWIAHTYLFP